MPRSALSITGGNPSGMPDFKPINKLSRDEIRAKLAPIFSRAPLYQVWVETCQGLQAIGPKCPHTAADALCGAIREQIHLGREKLWSNPLVIPVSLS